MYLQDFKARQLDDLLNDRHGCDGNSCEFPTLNTGSDV